MVRPARASRSEARTFFAVDRGDRLRQGHTIRLERRGEGAAARWFPKGLTPHGQDFVLDEHADAEGIRIEIMLELLRRASFPQKPSRMQAVFAFGSLEQARRFRKHKRQEDAPIWELRARAGHRGDMRLLRWRKDMMSNLAWAERYWRGAASARPTWEFLLLPPVRVARQAEPEKPAGRRRR